MLPARVFHDGALLGEATGLEIRAATEEFWSSGVVRPPAAMQCTDEGDGDEAIAATPDYLTLQGRLLAPLPKTSRQLLCKLLGLHTQRRTAPELAVGLGMDLGRCRARVDEIRAQLHERSPTLLRLLRRELDQLLETHDGLLTIESVPSPTVANTLASGSGHRLLPFRLAEFCFPELYTVYAQRLVACSASQRSLIAGKLRQLTEPRLLPRTLESICSELSEYAAHVPDGLLRFLLVRESRCQVKQNADRTLWVKLPDRSLAGRLVDVMKHCGQPTGLVDLVFEYRGCFRHASRKRLETCMHRNREFLEISPGLWSLREWHLDELLALREDANELAAAIEVCEESRDVGALLESETAEHSVFLIVDILRDGGAWSPH